MAKARGATTDRFKRHGICRRRPSNGLAPTLELKDGIIIELFYILELEEKPVMTEIRGNSQFSKGRKKNISVSFSTVTFAWGFGFDVAIFNKLYGRFKRS